MLHVFYATFFSLPEVQEMKASTTTSKHVHEVWKRCSVIVTVVSLKQNIFQHLSHDIISLVIISPSFPERI